MKEYGKKAINLDWKFSLSDNADYALESFDDSSWRKLNVPHDWSIESTPSRENENDQRGGFYKAGIGWYRKIIQKPQSERAFLEFDAVYKDAEVFVNGTKVIHFPYGFLSFRTEITEQLKDGENVIAVHANDEFGKSSRWYNGGGIYRPVYLIEKNSEYIIPETFAYYENISKENATLNVEFKTCGGKLVNISLLDKENNCVATTTANTCDEKVTMNVAKPTFWDITNPYLYNLKLELLDENETVVDIQEIASGIRTIEFTADKGFFLNGKHLKIKGVCQHHDAGALGAVVPTKIMRERIQDLLDCGVNAIRTGHTPFGMEFYDLCNEMGMMVMDEMFDGWYAKAVHDYAGVYFNTRGKDDLRHFIKRDRNHPCVILWGIGNETGDDDIHNLTAVCHETDPTRLNSGGQLLNGVGVTGLNGPSEAPSYLEQLYAQKTGKPVLCAEYPHCYATRGFYRTQTWWRDYGRPRFDIGNYSESEIFDDYQAKISHVVRYNSSYDNNSVRISNKDAWKRVRDFEHVVGMFMWTGHDYLGESFGWPYRSGNYGILDLAGFPKDTYFLYQSMWSDKAMLHVLPHWNHAGKEGLLIPVVAYTTCESVELFLNGVSYGKQAMNGKQELVWHIPYAAGKLEAVGYHKNGEVLHCVKQTEANAAKIELSAYETLLSDKQDTVSVKIAVTDNDGNFCNKATDRIFFDVTGGGFLNGIENGDPFDLEAAKANNRKVFYGLEKAYLTSNGKDEETTVNAFAVLGAGYFDEKAICTISASKLVLGKTCEDLNCKFLYSTDGSEPTIEYTGAFELTDTCTVKAVAILGDKKVALQGEFVKGSMEEESSEFAMPLYEEIVGTWSCGEKGVKFYANGDAETLLNGEKTREVSWWYEQPIDQFESDTGDIDSGELQFPFDIINLKLMKDGTLRFKAKKAKTTTIEYYRKG